MSIRVLSGDCRAVLPTLEAGSVHCVVTSPPYFGLRDYGTASWAGGDPACDHAKGTAASVKSTLKNDGRAVFGSNDYERAIVVPYRDKCGKCGATRTDAQIGLEPTPAEYVAELVAVFREVRRVLRDDGTCWLNLGDSYASSTKGSGGSDPATSPKQAWKGAENGQGFTARRFDMASAGLKAKDLIGIPWRVAFALQADGWWLRQDIIWSKPNPMPESVRDRCTKAHEYVFLLSKSERYWFDAAAISEKVAPGNEGSTTGFYGSRAGAMGRKASGNEARSIADQPIRADTRNRRSVWSIPSQPFADAHFATMPPALADLCIRAGCPQGGTVLDPFGGAGTTGLVADRLHRRAILIELNPDYAAMAGGRITGESPLFAVLE